MKTTTTKTTKPKLGRPPRGITRPVFERTTVAPETRAGIRAESDRLNIPIGHVLDRAWTAYLSVTRAL